MCYDQDNNLLEYSQTLKRDRDHATQSCEKIVSQVLRLLKFTSGIDIRVVNVRKCLHIAERCLPFVSYVYSYLH